MILKNSFAITFTELYINPTVKTNISVYVDNSKTEFMWTNHDSSLDESVISPYPFFYN